MIVINRLELYTEPSLIFTANTPERKGLAVKSYTLDIPNTPNNNKELNNLWGGGVVSTVTMPATYNLTGITLRGTLTIDTVSAKSAKAIFVSGNGYLWARMGQTRLRDIPMTGANVVLNKTNVLASESGSPFVLFDMTDRGAFQSSVGIDITDRFPALQVKELLRRVVNHFGAGVVFDEWRTRLDDKYLLYTQDSNIRNSAEWLQQSGCEADEDALSIQNNTQGAGQMIWIEVIPLVASKDAGGNWFGTYYRCTELGTYRAKAQMARLSFVFEDDMGTPAQLSYNSVSNRARVTVGIRQQSGAYIAWYRNTETITGGTLEIEGIDIDTLPVELVANNQLSLQVRVDADVTFTMGTMSRFTMSLEKPAISVVGSRWYGAGSTVRLAEVLPDMTAIDLVKMTSAALGLDLFYDDRTNILTIRSGRDVRPLDGQIACMTWTSEREQAKNILIDQPTDKAAPPDNHYIDVGGGEVEVHQLDVARTYVGGCFRLFGSMSPRVPVLWQSGDPTDFDQTSTPPPQQTRAAMRIVQRLPNVSGSYRLTYGGSASDMSELRTTAVQLVDVNTRELLMPDLALRRERWVAVARLQHDKLADLTYFKRPVTLYDNIKQLVVGQGMMLQAERVKGEWYRVEVQPLVSYDINASDISRAVQTAPPPTSAGVGGGVQVADPQPLPADVWRSSTAGQVAALQEKTQVDDNDTLLVEESGAKRSVLATNAQVWFKRFGQWISTKAMQIITSETGNMASLDVVNNGSSGGMALAAVSYSGVGAHLAGHNQHAAELMTTTSAGYGAQSVVKLIRSNDNPQNNIAGAIEMMLSNTNGGLVSPAHIVWRLTDPTVGWEKGELDFVVNAVSRMKITDQHRLEMQSGSDIEFKGSSDGVILKAPNGDRYRVTVNNSGQLVITAV